VRTRESGTIGWHTLDRRRLGERVSVGSNGSGSTTFDILAPSRRDFSNDSFSGSESLFGDSNQFGFALAREAEVSLVALIVTFRLIPLDAKAPGPSGLIINLSPEIANTPPPLK